MNVAHKFQHSKLPTAWSWLVVLVLVIIGLIIWAIAASRGGIPPTDVSGRDHGATRTEPDGQAPATGTLSMRLGCVPGFSSLSLPVHIPVGG